MLNRRPTFLAVVSLALFLLATSAPSAHAVGYWNLPGTYMQYFGYGNGPGYHVPIVLGPPQCCDGWIGMGVRRLPHAPTAWPSASCACENGGVTSPTPLYQTSRLP